MATAYEKQRKGYESLQRLVASLADSLNRPLPHLPEATTRLAPEGGVSLVSKQACCSSIHGCSLNALNIWNPRTHPMLLIRALSGLHYTLASSWQTALSALNTCNSAAVDVYHRPMLADEGAAGLCSMGRLSAAGPLRTRRQRHCTSPCQTSAPLCRRCCWVLPLSRRKLLMASQVRLKMESPGLTGERLTQPQLLRLMRKVSFWFTSPVCCPINTPLDTTVSYALNSASASSNMTGGLVTCGHSLCSLQAAFFAC